MRPMLRRILAGMVVAVALVATGCGEGGDPPPPGTPSAAEYLLTPADIRRQPEDSPQAALMEWWRSIQYNDFDGYANALVAPLRAQREASDRARRDLTLASGELIRSQPEIADVREDGNETTIYTRIETRQPVGATRFTTSSSPQAFTLVREGGEWRIADDFYVTNRANNIRTVLNEAKKKSGGS
jgi:hypothetical protein